MDKTKKLDVIRDSVADITLPSRGLSIYAHLDKRRKNSKNQYPIRIRIVHNSLYRDYGTKQNATLEQFNLILSQKPKGIEASIKIEIIALLNRAIDIVKELNPFNFAEFNEVYLNKRNNDRSDIFNWYEDKITELKKNGQIGTADSYYYSKNSLKEFTKADTLYFDKVNVQFLQKYEKWLFKNGKSSTTVGIYLRPLRHIFNRAMERSNNIVLDYPFKKYKIPSPQNIKKALTRDMLKRIYWYEPEEDSPEEFYRDLWLFSYFANGINMKDICNLTYKMTKGGFIEFRRAKTIRTNKDSKPIAVVLTDDLKRLIEKHGTKPIKSENYIFPFLNDKLDERQEMDTIKQVTKQCNKYIKRVAIQVGIDVEISTYTARHSFATILKNAGVAPSFIGESMGHANMRTTDSYFGSFETDQRKENISKLKDW